MAKKIQQYPPLEFATEVTNKTNAAWDDGSFLQSVTPTTEILLRYWFDPDFTEQRGFNFHKGQKQALLNTIYIHEVLKKDRVLDVYEMVNPQILIDNATMMQELSDDIYNHPKYCIKMATGTGKTWVFEALLIWQFLNAKHNPDLGNYTKNFLLVAPGLIVYERLLDAFLGRQKDEGVRDFDTSDFKQFEELFIPEEFRDEIYGFLQSSVAKKEEIGKKVVGEGVVAITNFHRLMGAEESEDVPVPVNRLESWSLPVSPGVSAGNSLDVLDNTSGDKHELEYLAKLPDLMVVNDEAHHIHKVSKDGEKSEVEWQKSLRFISTDKAAKFIQVDFSATPYNEISSGGGKIYFPHIIVDFDLKHAIKDGLVKTLILDERKELTTETLDFKAIRQGNVVVDLSEGQRAMIRAGIKKLNILEKSFSKIADNNKSPKMLVMCEDTNVVPEVMKFLKGEDGISEEDILEIHSGRKSELTDDEWKNVKYRLFSLDKEKQPRIVVSVLMLREGFDVNNICVIVPLRSSASGILLEQTIGRGLRLMWRGDEQINEVKQRDRQLFSERKPPESSFDLLYIIEHPAFRKFYDELIADGEVFEEAPGEEPVPTGTILPVCLRDDYVKYDFRFPFIVNESEEIMSALKINIDNLKPFNKSMYDVYKRYLKKGDVWASTEVTERVKYGDYEVINGVFHATSYNDYLSRLVGRIEKKATLPVDAGKSSKKWGRVFPVLSINSAELARFVDEYIRKRLFEFDAEFNPDSENSWRILQVDKVLDHIVSQIAGIIVASQEAIEPTEDDQVLYRALSEVDKITVQENYYVPVKKCIYSMLPYPSNRGGLEKDFIEMVDLDGEVDAFCKIIENRHTFVRFRYIKESGLPARYVPDFFVRIGNDIYIIETKAQRDISAQDVIRKKKSAIRWCDKINKLPENKREGLTWHYCIIGHEDFKDWKKRRFTTKDMIELSTIHNEDDGVVGNGSQTSILFN